MKLVATCNPGTEDVVAEEIEWEVEGARVLEAREQRGRVVFEAVSPREWLVLAQVQQLRSIHSAFIVVGEGRVRLSREGLEDAWRVAYEARLHRYIPWGGAFAVEGVRVGEGHEYTSVDLAAKVGDAVQRRALEEEGVAPQVRLSSPTVTIQAYLDRDYLMLGPLVTGERSRHRRRYRVYDHPAALKATLAYVMLRLAGARDGETILDPMCGGGTVAIEAALLFPTAKLICVELNRRHVEGALLNSWSARVAGRVEVIHGDATRLSKILEGESVDRIVSNPPYGIRLGDPVDVRILYRRFMPEAAKVMKPGATAAIITAEPGYLRQAAERAGLKEEHSRRVRHGDLWVDIIVFRKPEH